MTAPFWLPDELAEANAYVPGVEIATWDKVALNDEVLPGICRIVVPMMTLRIDEHRLPGFSGSPFVPLGVNNATLDLEWKLVTPSDWADAQGWIATLWGNPWKVWRGAGYLQKAKQMTPAQARAVVHVWSISHPALAESQFDKGVVIGYQPPVDGPEGPQIKVVKFRFRQWIKTPKRAPDKPQPVHPVFKMDPTAPDNLAADPPSITATRKRK